MDDLTRMLSSAGNLDGVLLTGETHSSPFWSPEGLLWRILSVMFSRPDRGWSGSFWSVCGHDRRCPVSMYGHFTSSAWPDPLQGPQGPHVDRVLSWPPQHLEAVASEVRSCLGCFTCGSPYIRNVASSQGWIWCVPPSTRRHLSTASAASSVRQLQFLWQIHQLQLLV